MIVHRTRKIPRFGFFNHYNTEERKSQHSSVFSRFVFFSGRDDGWYVEFVSQFWSQIPLLFTDVDGPDNSVL
jgi:hypothetical protein